MGRSTTTIVNEFAVRPELLRRAIARHRSWTEQQLGVSMSETVILETDLDLAQIGIELFLSMPQPRRPTSSIARRLRRFVLSATTPPEFPPFCEITKSPRNGNLLAFLGGKSTLQKSTLSWEDCPIALNIRRSKSEFTAIALNLAYHSGPGSDYETTARLIVARRESASDVVRLIEDLDRRDNKPRLHIVGGSDRHIVGCKWDDLVLDYKVRTMLKDDFESRRFDRRKLQREIECKRDRNNGFVDAEQEFPPTQLDSRQRRDRVGDSWDWRKHGCGCRSRARGGDG
jgi:hypothetical protein